MNMMKKNGGFTLVELIVVIAILAILAGVAVPAYSGYLTKAKDAAVVSELSAVLTAAQAAAVSSTNGGEISYINVTSGGVISVDGTDVTDGSAFDTFYGSHTFGATMTGTSYASGANWTTGNGWATGIYTPAANP